MRHAHLGAKILWRNAPARAGARRHVAGVALGAFAALVAFPGRADAQIGSANVPLPNVLLLLDTSGSFEHMIDGSNPEDPQNNGATYANCETAWNNGVPAIPNRWGVAVQALTGTVRNTSGQPYYSCVTMDRADGASVPASLLPPPINLAGNVPPALAAAVKTNGLDSQYGLRNEAGQYFYPYDSGYYLPFHRPVSLDTLSPAPRRCVYSPGELPGASFGGVGLTGGAPAAGDCPNEGSGFCQSGDFPQKAIGQFYYDSLATATGPVPIGSTTLATPNVGYAGTSACTFEQATDGLIDQASTLVRFGLMTYDNDPAPAIGLSTTAVPYSGSPFVGQWSYFPGWNTGATTSISGEPALCTTPYPFELGARNPDAPPWEGRLLGFPNPEDDVLATAYSNGLVQQAINAMRPYGATPTGALMADAAYYFWGDPAGPNGVQPNADPFVASGCRSQYIILLTDGAPNQDLRTSCQGPGGSCPYHLPEETAAILANAGSDPGGTVAKTPTPPALHGNVYTYVIGFAVSGNNSSQGNFDGGTGNVGLANCAELSLSQLSALCGATTAPHDSTPDSGAPGYSSLESPCCSLQRIAVAGGTQHAYFADTPGDLDTALAAVLGDIEGQLGSRTLPAISPNVSYTAGVPLTATFVSSLQASTCPATGPCTSSQPWTGDVQRQAYVCGTGPTVEPDDDFSVALTTQNLVAGGAARNFLVFNGWGTSGTTGTNALTLRPYLNVEHQIGTTVIADNLDTFGAYQQGGEERVAPGSPSSVYNEFTSFCTSAQCPALGTTPTSCQDPATLKYGDSRSCTNLALSFAMAQSTFLPGSPEGPGIPNLLSQYASGADGNNVGGVATNRANYPFGGIIDSTPTIVGPPAAQVRDDSYQAFSLDVAGATPVRDTMLYVATVDGLLHAFDTSVGLMGGVSNVESWAFIPPAVLPNLMSNYPGANNILLDGAPVVKDVVFSRQDPENLATWTQAWHTMLVAGFGQGGRGYYALDVTDPRAPTSPSLSGSAVFAAASGGSGTPGVYPTSATSLHGPHFQWQITSENIVGNTTYTTSQSATELFGKVSGTPAITTVFADPAMIAASDTRDLSPQEIGVAILPGGRDGNPVAGLTCPRELATSNFIHYATAAGVYGATGGSTIPAKQLQTGGASTSPYNLSDPNFQPRLSTRAWSANCTGTQSNVPGRSVMVVSIATGQILAVFARAAPTSGVFTATYDPTAWDVPSDGTGKPYINPAYLVPTPLDSPMTGTPVVYPSGVGVVAQSVYIGDADGTMWRFDLSDPNPRNWTGAIFADAYSPTADASGGDSVTASAATPDWPAFDSQAISIPPAIALDTSAQVTVDFATGDQMAFNACYAVPGLQSTAVTGVTNPNCAPPLQPTVNFLYSVRESRLGAGGTPLAQVKWYQEWPNSSQPNTAGERVTGPMSIFDNYLYFATYAPPDSSTGNQCTTGGPGIFAWNFANPKTPCSIGPGGVGCGGAPTTDPTFTNGELTGAALVTATGATVNPNTVIPGVIIDLTPSCATTSAIGSDSYAGAGHTTATPTTTGTYSLIANIGKKSALAGGNLVTKTLQAPRAPTIVDSWATISE